MEYTLSNDLLDVRVASFGAALTSVKNKEGLEYLWQGDPTYWSGQAPVLFPICGSIRGDRAVTEDGTQLAMPRHGLVRKREFAFESRTANEITFTLNANLDTMAHYPYAFNLKITYTLEGTTVRTIYTVTNLGSVPMPYLIGGHPGFRCPLVEGESYEDYYLEFAEAETANVPTPVTETGLIDVSTRTPLLTGEKTLDLTHDLFAVDAQILDELVSRSVTLRSKKSDNFVRLDFEQFPFLILWSSANGGDFVALEPWMGLSTCSDEDDVFEHKRNCQILAPSATTTYSFDITVG